MPQPTIKYLDRPDVAESFADHCQQVMFDGQTLRIELAVTRYGEPTADRRPTASRTTAARLVLSPQAALQLHDQLQRLVSALEEKGLVKKRAAMSSPTKQ